MEVNELTPHRATHSRKRSVPKPQREVGELGTTPYQVQGEYGEHSSQLQQELYIEKVITNLIPVCGSELKIKRK